MCWTLCYKTNICTKCLLISDDDAFKIWCIFNFLSEDKYPLVIITEEVRKSLSSCSFLLGSEHCKKQEEHFKHQGNMLLSSFLFCPSPQIEYLLRKLMEVMGSRWSEENFADYKLQLHSKKNCLTVWELIELLGIGYFIKDMNHQTVSMGINEVFQELILDVLKQVRKEI